MLTMLTENIDALSETELAPPVSKTKLNKRNIFLRDCTHNFSVGLSPTIITEPTERSKAALRCLRAIAEQEGISTFPYSREQCTYFTTRGWLTDHGQNIPTDIRSHPQQSPKLKFALKIKFYASCYVSHRQT